MAVAVALVVEVEVGWYGVGWSGVEWWHWCHWWKHAAAAVAAVWLVPVLGPRPPLLVLRLVVVGEW